MRIGWLSSLSLIFDGLRKAHALRRRPAITCWLAGLTAAIGFAASGASATPTIAGVWLPAHPTMALRPLGGSALPFTPEGRAAFQHNQSGLQSGQLVDEAVHLCLPHGMPRALTSRYPFQIVQAPDALAFVHEENRSYRIVRMSGQHEDAESWDPAYMGEPIAHWEGDTLIIDSTNFKSDRIFLDGAGIPASDKLHLVERIRLTDGGRRLQDLITIDDPKVFTKAWTARLDFNRRDDIVLRTDWVCGEPQRNLATLKQAARATAPTLALRPLSGGAAAIDGFWSGAKPEPGAPSNPFVAQSSKVMTPKEAEFYRNFVSGEAAGQLQRTPKNLCLPSTVPGTNIPTALFYSMGVLVDPGVIAFLYEENRSVRIVRMNAQHPADLQPSWMGDSVGHWQGDTLVVDSIGFNDRNQIVDGLPATHRLHVVERIRVVDGVLEDQATFDDPGAFDAPFSVTTRYKRTGPFQEFICAENNREGGVPTSAGVPTPAKGFVPAKGASQ